MRRLMILLLLGITLLLFSCVSMNASDPNSTLPSNRPANWENQSLGVPL